MRFQIWSETTEKGRAERNREAKSEKKKGQIQKGNLCGFCGMVVVGVAFFL